MAKIAKNSNKNVFIHIITDGRDVAPDCAKNILNKFYLFVMIKLKLQQLLEDIIQWIEIIDGIELKKVMMLLLFANPKSKSDI